MSVLARNMCCIFPYCQGIDFGVEMKYVARDSLTVIFLKLTLIPTGCTQSRECSYKLLSNRNAIVFSYIIMYNATSFHDALTKIRF